jgi:hypothetical protein
MPPGSRLSATGLPCSRGCKVVQNDPDYAAAENFTPGQSAIITLIHNTVFTLNSNSASMLTATDDLLTVLCDFAETCDISIAAFAEAHPVIALISEVWGRTGARDSLRLGRFLEDTWKPLMKVVGCSVFTSVNCIKGFVHILRTVIFPVDSKVVGDRLPVFISLLEGAYKQAPDGLSPDWTLSKTKGGVITEKVVSMYAKACKTSVVHQPTLLWYKKHVKNTKAAPRLDPEYKAILLQLALELDPDGLQCLSAIGVTRTVGRNDSDKGNQKCIAVWEAVRKRLPTKYQSVPLRRHCISSQMN